MERSINTGAKPFCYIEYDDMDYFSDGLETEYVVK